MKDLIGRARLEGALLFAAVCSLAVGAVGSGVTAWLTGHVGCAALVGALTGALTSPLAGTMGADLALFLEAGPDVDRYRTRETRRTRVRRWVATIALASFVGAAALPLLMIWVLAAIVSVAARGLAATWVRMICNVRRWRAARQRVLPPPHPGPYRFPGAVVAAKPWTTAQEH